MGQIKNIKLHIVTDIKYVNFEQKETPVTSNSTTVKLHRDGLKVGLNISTR